MTVGGRWPEVSSGGAAAPDHPQNQRDHREDNQHADRRAGQLIEGQADYPGHEGDDPQGDFPGRNDASFWKWCERFLAEQMQLMQPRAVVALGTPAQEKLGAAAGQVTRAQMFGVEFALAGLHHPSYPQYYRRVQDGRQLIDDEAELLKRAAE